MAAHLRGDAEEELQLGTEIPGGDGRRTPVLHYFLSLLQLLLLSCAGRNPCERWSARRSRWGLFAPDAQRICHSIDVVEPRRDQRNLQDCLIVESRSAQAIMIIFPDFGGVFCEFDYVVQHHPLLLGDGGGRVVLLQCFNQRFIQRYSTQKLCV